MLGVAFVLVERRSDHPMLDLSLFAKPAFDGASIAAFVLSASMFSMFLYLTLYIQNILGYTPLESGLRFLPVTLLSFLVAPISGKFAERVGHPLVPGRRPRVRRHRAAADARASSPATTGPRCWRASWSPAAASGSSTRALATAAVGVVEPRRAGMASGINSTFRQVGIATGIAGLGAIFQHLVASSFDRRARTAGSRRASTAARSPTSSASAAPRRVGDAALTRLAEQAFVDGLNDILLYAALLAFVGAILAAVLTRPGDFFAHGEPAAA